MRVLSLFSGIGGLELGLEWAGMETVGQCESDQYARKVLKKHWNVPLHDDIRSLTGEWVRNNCGHIDLICGGFPCQDISVAGKGAGIKGERSGLWQEMRRVIGEVRPRWALAENVPALRTRGADEVLGQLEELGYSCWPLVVGAVDVGAPHRRRRVWVVAYANEDTRWPSGQGLSRQGRQNERLANIGEVAHAPPSICLAGSRLRQHGESSGWRQPAGSSQDAANCDCKPERRLAVARSQCGKWLPEPGVGRVADGVSCRMDRLRCLGNAVVPQVAEQLGRAIMEVELAYSRSHRAAA